MRIRARHAATVRWEPRTPSGEVAQLIRRNPERRNDRDNLAGKVSLSATDRYSTKRTR